MIDIHCHILPGVDDGPKDFQESVLMARHALKDGIHTIVATPHALGGSFSNPNEKIENDVEALKSRFKSLKIELTLYPGAEIHISPGMAKKVISGETMFIDRSKKYILIEFPFQTVPPAFAEELFKLKVSGITPIIAHPERNRMICRDFQLLYEIVKIGCITQINSTSITGGFGEDIMMCAQNLIKLGLAHIIASDAHSAIARPPALSDAIEVAANILKSRKKALEMVNERPFEIGRAHV